MPEKKDFRDSSIYKLLSDLSLIHWVLQLAVSFWTTWRSQPLMPSSVAHPAEYWLATASVFSGTLAVSSISVRAAANGWEWVKRRRSPHSLVIAAHGGEAATLELKHYGEHARWQVRWRIREVLLDGVPNPSPVLHLCTIRRDSQVSGEVELRHEESASIILAKIRSNWQTDSWMAICGVAVPNEGVIVELEITATPPTQEGVMRRRYRICRGKPVAKGLYVRQLVHPNEITIEDVSGH